MLLRAGEYFDKSTTTDINIINAQKWTMGGFVIMAILGCLFIGGVLFAFL
jgi:hypothetical protein